MAAKFISKLKLVLIIADGNYELNELVRIGTCILLILDNFICF